MRIESSLERIYSDLGDDVRVRYLKRFLRVARSMKKTLYMRLWAYSSTPRYDSGMIKISVSITPELHSALTLSALDRHTNLSREIETFLRENATVEKYISRVRDEPDIGAFATNPEVRRISRARGLEAAASSSE